ncbi:MAG TPA: hypothetical protein PLY66_10270 [Acidobacteriota bacterium]|nr:hypothetical protein [Acidobacteriota bacterium]HOT01379.1 hypothetical protein [Acidobacteriota bacterium]HQF87112.1 hypothetical protein [Acidobacteriota bacterium]HQG91673.1 hypothetical protein [Acidobacteriota bacterium]
MKKLTATVMIIGLILSIAPLAAIGKTTVAFTESEYAKSLNLKLNLQKPDLNAYVGTGKEMIVIKTKKEIVYYERFTWLSSAMPTDESVRHAAYINFLSQAADIPSGTPEYDQLAATVKSNTAEFILRGLFQVRVRAENGDKGAKHFVEIYVK